MFRQRCFFRVPNLQNVALERLLNMHPFENSRNICGESGVISSATEIGLQTFANHMGPTGPRLHA